MSNIQNCNSAMLKLIMNLSQRSHCKYDIWLHTSRAQPTRWSPSILFSNTWLHNSTLFFWHSNNNRSFEEGECLVK